MRGANVFDNVLDQATDEPFWGDPTLVVERGGLCERADLVIVVSHLGTALDCVLAREVEGADVVLGGTPTTSSIRPSGRRPWIAQALSDGLYVG